MATVRLYVTNSSDQTVDATPERIVDAVNAGHIRREFLMQDDEPVTGLVIDIGARYGRDHGEQPEEVPRSSIGACPFCERVPCEDGVHALWRLGRNGIET